MSSDPIGPDELASILRNVGDGITAQGPDGRLVYANDAAAQLCGLASAAEMLSLSGAELLERFEIIGEDGESAPDRRAPEPPGARRSGRRRTPSSSATGSSRSGDERWSIVRSTPILNEAGEIRLVITVFHDVTEQRHAEERIRFLAETGTLFSAGLDYAATLAELGALLVPRLADYCLVDVIEEESGSLRQVVISHRDPEREQLLRTLRQRYPPEENASHPVTEVLRTGEPYLVEDARDAALVACGGGRGAPRALPQARGDVVHRRPARVARTAARDDLPRHGRVGAAVQQPSTSSWRERSAAAPRSRSRTRSSSAPRASRMRSSTRFSSPPRWESASGIASCASCA